MRKRAWAEMCAAMIAVGCYIDVGAPAGGRGLPPGPTNRPPRGGALGDGEDAEEESRKRRRVEVVVSKTTVGQQLQAAKGDLRKLWGAPDADG